MKEELPLKLYMIPGTGTDNRMFAPQYAAFSNLEVPAWIPPVHLKEPLADYAARLAETIDVSTPFVLGGVSLGGMLAQELALRLKPAGVLMISTACSSKAMPLSRRLAGRLTRRTPDTLVKWLLNSTAKNVMKTKLEHKHLYAAMLKEIPPQLVRWQSGAATQWERNFRLDMPVFHLQGGKDTIIPLKNVRPDKVIEDGGHLINITHAGKVNNFIRESMAKIAQTPFASEPSPA